MKTYTGNDIKKLSGLDDTRILKGRDNFDQAKRVVGELCTPEMLGLTEEATISALKEEAIGTKKRIDDAELFYRIKFPAHVQSEAEYSCCGFECGFRDSEGKECITCPKENTHRNPCNKCSDMYAVIETLQDKHKIAIAQGNVSVTKQDDLD